MHALCMHAQTPRVSKPAHHLLLLLLLLLLWLLLWLLLQ